MSQTSSAKAIAIRAGLVLGGLFLFLVLLNAFGIWFASRSSNTAIARIAEAGQPVTLADLDAPAPSKEEDAAAILAGVKQQIQAVNTIFEPLFKDDEEIIFGFPLEPTDVRQIKAVFDMHPELLPAFEQAARATHYGVHVSERDDPAGVIQDVSDRGTIARNVCRILSVRAMQLKLEGEFDAALEQCLTIFRLCRHFDREPLTTSFLNGLACRNVGVMSTNAVLRAGEVSEPLRKALDEELALHDLNASLPPTFLSERAFGIASFQSVIETKWIWPLRAIWIRDLDDSLSVMDRAVSVAEKPFDMNGFSKIVGQRQLGDQTIVAMQSVLHSYQGSAELTALLRCVRVLNALLPLAKEGKTPTIEELPLPEEAKQDPFIRKPLRLRGSNEEGWIIYSVGANQQDDNADGTDLKDVVLQPPRTTPLPPSQPGP